MDDGRITRAALGSDAAFGDLYDARKDDFTGFSIFKKSIPESAKTLVDSHSSEIHLVHSDDFSEKSSKMDINASLQVSVLAGLFPLEGSGRYLSDHRKSGRTVRSSLIYKIGTKKEAVNIYHEDLEDCFSMESIESGVATHVVQAISYGANSIVSCTYENKENRDVKEIRGGLSAALNEASLSISGKGSGEYSAKHKSDGIKFDVRIFGDILAQDLELPTTPEEAFKFIKKMPSLVATSNKGKGKPLSYTLIPLSLLSSLSSPSLNFSIKVDNMWNSLHETSLVRVVQLFDQMSAAQQKLNDFHQDAIDYQYCVQPEDIARISDLKAGMAIQEMSFRSELSTVLIQIRSGKSKEGDLEEIFSKFQSSDASPKNVTQILSNWATLIGKISFAKALVEGGAKYIGLGGSLDEEVLKDFKAKSFALFFTQQAMLKEPSKWEDTRKLFFHEMVKKGKGHKYYVVDCDFHPNSMIKNHCFIQVLQNGQVIIHDLLKDQEETKHFPLAQAISDTERLLCKPEKLVPLSIPCPGNTCDPSKIYDWTCKKCKEKIYYGFEAAYCKCGKTPAHCLEFKCTDPNHGVAFEVFDETFLLKVLGNFISKEINILLLGETGVGKSLFIDGFINYLSYKSLEDAKMGKLFSPNVPSKLIFRQQNLADVEVSTRENNNEGQQAGHSTTQKPAVILFKIKDKIIRLIDTPGIGDIRGVVQDKKNFENILAGMSKFDEIHGICILLKPDNTKLNVKFRFCIKEVLTHFPRDACKNIMFCFTHSFGPSYRTYLEDTRKALQQVLLENKNVKVPVSPDNIFFCDSEAYMHVAALKHNPPKKFTDEEKAYFKSSWEKSRVETQRMVKYIGGMEPHKIVDTIAFNQSRGLVLELSQWFAELRGLIQTNAEKNQVKKIEEALINSVFANFLKSAIIPYNDATEEVLELFIKREVEKVGKSNLGRSTLDHLNKILETFIIHKRLLNSSLK